MFKKVLFALGKKPYFKTDPKLKDFSAGLDNYFTELTPEIKQFAKANKVTIEISPRKNPQGEYDFSRIRREYDMDFLDTKVNNIKKRKFAFTDPRSLYNANEEKSLFVLRPNFDKNPVPFKDNLFAHLQLIVENLKRK